MVYQQVVHCASDYFCANGCTGDDVAADEATTPPPSGNLYPNSGKQAKKVENPATAVRKSLPKRRKIPPAQT
ncbi:MAG: hypothetical protein EGR17_00415 [Butyrivibrio crossotus]|nr:hypothetical protein [Butyrivibrio crossotus]